MATQSLRAALVAGIDDYGEASDLAPLRFAESDARLMAETFEKEFLFSRVACLCGPQASRKALYAVLEDLSRETWELFVFYFGGHGEYIESEGMHYLHAHGSRAGDDAEALSLAGWGERIRRKVTARHTLLIVDACRNRLHRQATARGEESGLSGAILDPLRELGISSREVGQRRSTTDGFAAPRYLTTLLACGTGQKSWEDESLGHGVFTHYLHQELVARGRQSPLDQLVKRAGSGTYNWCQQNRKTAQVPELIAPALEEATLYLVDRHGPDGLSKRLLGKNRERAAACRDVAESSGATVFANVPWCGQKDRLENTAWLKELNRLQQALVAVVNQKLKNRRANMAWLKELNHLQSALIAVANQRVDYRRASSASPQPKIQAGTFVSTPSGFAFRIKPGEGRQLARAGGLESLIREWGLVRVPAGSFMMGSENQESEKPTRRVHMPHDFWMGATVVTQGLWIRVKGKLPWFDYQGDEFPLLNTNWHDARNFIRDLNELAGGGFRLPSEAEWEYACRAGSRTRYCFGDDKGQLDAYSWYKHKPKDPQKEQARPVSGKRPNAWGLFDMHGNVWEWCQDPWHDNYRNAPADGRSWDEGGRPDRRVLRGGSWDSRYHLCTSTYRRWSDPGSSGADIGFRLVWQPPAE